MDCERYRDIIRLIDLKVQAFITALTATSGDVGGSYLGLKRYSYSFHWVTTALNLQVG